MMLTRYMMLMFIGSLLTASPALRAQPNPTQPKEDQILSIGATIRLALEFQSVFPPNWEQRERCGNPAARPALYAILEDPDSHSDWPGILRMLGYVGDGADGRKLVAFLKDPRANDETVVSAALGALALLHQRKQEGADELVDQVVRPAFWRQVHFRPTTQPAPVKGRLPFELDMSRLAISNLARVDRAYAKARAARIQASIEDADDRHVYGEFMQALFP